jgi:TonB family protein
VGDVVVLSEPPGNRGFGRAAALAVKKWRVRPALRAGKPVDSTTTVAVQFKK